MHTVHAHRAIRSERRRMHSREHREYRGHRVVHCWYVPRAHGHLNTVAV